MTLLAEKVTALRDYHQRLISTGDIHEAKIVAQCIRIVSNDRPLTRRTDKPHGTQLELPLNPEAP